MVVSLNIKSLLTKENIAFIIIAIIAVVLAIYFRTTMLQYYGFYEPDGFYYFSVMRAIVNDHFYIPATLNISGWPQHALVAEAHGIYWVTLLPYIFLGPLGISYYTIMRLIPVAFGILDMFAAYLLSRYLSKDKLLGALTLLFVGLSMGNAARTSALVYRGDTFVTFFLLMALVLFIEVFRQNDQRRKIIFAAAAGIALALCNLVWTGAGFADATFMFAFVLLMSYAFLFRKEKIASDGRYLLLSILVWYIIGLLATAVHFIPGEQLVDASFIPIYICLALLWAFVYYLPQRMVHLVRTFEIRFAILASVVIIGIALFVLTQSSTIYDVFVGNGFVSTTSFASTTEELQPPTFSFLFTSFGINLFTSIPGLLVALSSYSGLTTNIWVSLYGVLGMVLVLLLFVPYLFMQVYDSSGLLNGKPKLIFDVNMPIVVLSSYFLITAYLEMHAIRFNSLLSVPVAIISAYTLYWIILAANSMKQFYIRFISLAICGVVMLYIFYSLMYYGSLYSSSLTQADSINPQFIGAMQWLKANSPNNSVVLTLWPDGSVVEAVANRTSVMDSVGSENGSKATPFAAWIFSDTPDPQILSTTIFGSPNYLVVRLPWLIETQGIYTESGINTNASLYGYAPLTSFSESQENATIRQLLLRLNPDTNYPAVIVNLGYSNASTSSTSISAYIELNSAQTVPFSYVAFENQNGNYTYINQSSLSGTNGELLLVQYSTIPRPQFFMNVTGSYVFGPGLGDSNMAKFLFLCGTVSCAWDTNQATARLVYQNQDTRIFKITYNSIA